MTSKLSSSLDGELVWSRISYSMRDFVETFGCSLPALIKTTAGYAGFDEGMHQVGSGEIYWVHDIQRQKRLVVQPEKSNCYLSIPTEYPIKVQVLQEGRKKLGPPVPVRDVLDVMCKRSSQVKMMFENNRPVSFQIGADLGSTAQLGVLTVLQTYEEKYLLANTIFQRSIFPHTQGIPVYLPIEFERAEALKTGGPKALSIWMKDIMDTMETSKRAPVRMCQELILFSERPSDNEYEYIKLTDFSNFKEKDKIYSAPIIKRQNPYDSNPNKPKPQGPTTHDLAQAASSNINRSVALPRFPAPFPPSVLPGTAGGSTSLTHGKSTTDSSRLANSSARSVPPPPGKGSSPASTGQSTPSHGIGLGRPIPSPKSTKNNQGNYEHLSPSPTPYGTYASLSEIPATVDIGKLTVEQVVDCLQLLRLGQHEETFRARNIDGMMVLCLTEEMLVKDFNFRSFDAIQFLMFAKEGWRPK